MLYKVVPIFAVPWGPHIALLYIFFGKPLAIKGTVLCIPKELPHAQFKEHWDKLNQYEQFMSYKRAASKAKRILYKHKKRTGVGILGSPTKKLTKDQ